MARVVISLRQDEVEALLRSAEAERRDPRAHAAYLVCVGLRQRGVLPVAAPQMPDEEDESRCRFQVKEVRP